MTQDDIRENVLPLFLSDKKLPMQNLNNPFNNVAVRPKFDKIKFDSIMYVDNTDNVTRQ